LEFFSAAVAYFMQTLKYIIHLNKYKKERTENKEKEKGEVNWNYLKKICPPEKPYGY
jgi:hypothetical protein